MQAVSTHAQLPVYSLGPDEITGNKNFRVYNFEGVLPEHAGLLVPHRKDHYLFVFLKKGGMRQWLDMKPYELKDNTVYFYNPGRIIVKEEADLIYSTAFAFTPEFLSLQENVSLSKLPLIQNPYNSHELILNAPDITFVEDLMNKIKMENQQPSEWRQRMLAAYVSLLLTYLSRLYTEQYNDNAPSVDQLLLRKFQAKIDESFQELHEVGDYASLLNISPGHLSEVVKNQSGRPAIKHIHDRLVMEARRLLFHTNNPLKEIAWDLGFSDASYFNRFFKRETGATPAGYRNQIREMYH
ncbi:AraC-type DNA-binding protein [Pedobacter westerhofensis]|uniref:AraC-type DNA-binding protein n=1 Tax=Pedobacter westerhofensis TaxID=425512 RepID=A0A521CAG6_9SPHI|nr:helix-turn-helix domain-containing protein [Pedobacter westerhofensis]SMO56355.1 AraC-type DNA-binding protein [Pedobacter westerhofensis]